MLEFVSSICLFVLYCGYLCFMFLYTFFTKEIAAALRMSELGLATPTFEALVVFSGLIGFFVILTFVGRAVTLFRWIHQIERPLKHGKTLPCVVGLAWIVGVCHFIISVVFAGSLVTWAVYVPTDHPDIPHTLMDYCWLGSRWMMLLFVICYAIEDVLVSFGRGNCMKVNSFLAALSRSLIALTQLCVLIVWMVAYHIEVDDEVFNMATSRVLAILEYVFIGSLLVFFGSLGPFALTRYIIGKCWYAAEKKQIEKEEQEKRMAEELRRKDLELQQQRERDQDSVMPGSPLSQTPVRATPANPQPYDVYGDEMGVPSSSTGGGVIGTELQYDDGEEEDVTDGIMYGSLIPPPPRSSNPRVSDHVSDDIYYGSLVAPPKRGGNDSTFLSDNHIDNEHDVDGTYLLEEDEHHAAGAVSDPLEHLPPTLHGIDPGFACPFPIEENGAEVMCGVECDDGDDFLGHCFDEHPDPWLALLPTAYLTRLQIIMEQRDVDGWDSD